MLGDLFLAMNKFSIGINGIKRLLETIAPHKAAGPDAIPTGFLRETATQIAPALTLVFVQ